MKFHELLLVISITLAIKCLLLFFAYLNTPSNEINLISLNRWDSRHYLKIAEHGYGKVNENDDNRFLIYFPPLFPFLIFLLNKLSGINFLYSSLIVSNIFSLFSSILLYQIAKYELNSSKKALYSVLLLNIFPTSYFLLLPYSESVFIFFILSFFYFLRVRENLGLSSLSLAGAILTRSIGVVFIPILIWNIYKEKYKFLEGAFYLTLVCASFLSQNLIGYIYHESFSFIYTYRLSYTIDFGLIPFYESYLILSALVRFPKFLFNFQFWMIHTWSIVFLFLCFFILILRFKYIPKIYSASMFFYLFFLSFCTHLIAMPRYALACVPIYLLLGSIDNWIILKLIVLVSFTMLLYFFNIFIGNSWAF